MDKRFQFKFLIVDYTIRLVDSTVKLNKLTSEFWKICERMKLKMNVEIVKLSGI